MSASKSGNRPRLPEGQDAREAYSGPERRGTPCAEAAVEPVILTRKLADRLNGIELSGCEVGDRLCLATHDAALIVAEGWARFVEPAERRRR